jgi:hypothetical protein
LELVREIVDNGPQEKLTWLLHTADAQSIYEKLGFKSQTVYPVMERRRDKAAGEAFYEGRPEAN